MRRATTLYEHPLHPYTHALPLGGARCRTPNTERSRERILLKGDLPSRSNPPRGCVFRTRCPKAQDRCADEIPLPVELAPGHRGGLPLPRGAPQVI